MISISDFSASRPKGRESRGVLARCARRSLSALAGTLLVCGVAFADATVSGTVTSDGDGVGGVFVAIVGTGGQYATTTDESGNYSVTVVTGTGYTISVQGPGFAAEQATGVDVASTAVLQDFALDASGANFDSLGVYGGQIGSVLADGKSGVFYASTTVIPQLYRTADYGGSWSPVTMEVDDETNGLSGSMNIFDRSAVTTSGFAGEIATVIGQTVYYSTDFGVTWSAVGGTAPQNPELHWGHAGSTSVLLAVSDSTTARADMDSSTPTFSDMTTPYRSAPTSKMAVANGSDDSYVAVVDGSGTLTIYALHPTADPPTTVGTTLGGFPSTPEFVRFGGAKASGAPPASVLVYSATSGAAVMATKIPATVSFSASDRSASTAISGGCGAQVGAIGSVSPLSSGTTGVGTVASCLVEQSGTASLTVTPIPGINNNTGLAYDAEHGGGGGLVIVSGDGGRGLVKSAGESGGVPDFPSGQDATAGTGAGTGGIAVTGFDVAVVKDTVFGPAGGTHIATALSGSGGALGVVSDDSGATFATVVNKGGRAVDWWQGPDDRDWLVFGHGGAGNLLSAVSDWTAETTPMGGPNVAGTGSTEIGTGNGQYDVTALAGVPGSDTFFIGGGDSVDQQGDAGAVNRATLTPGSPPTIGDITRLGEVEVTAAVRALAYCPATGSDSSVQDVLLIAMGEGSANSGGLVRVSDATGGSPSVGTVASLPDARVNDVRVDCATGVVYAGTGSNSGGPTGALYKSSDGGATFSELAVTATGAPPSLNYQVVALNPSDADEVMVAGNSEGYILRSEDAGASWEVVNSPNVDGGRNFLSEGVGDIEIPPASGAVSTLHTVVQDAQTVDASEALVATGGGLFAASVRGAVSGSACSSAADCGDDNSCTTDTCDGGTCSNTRAEGIAGIECELDRMGESDLCGSEEVHAKLAKVLSKKVAKARKLAQKAASTSKAKKIIKLAKKANKMLTVVTKKAAKFAKKSRISAECGTSIEQRVETIQGLISDLD